MGTHLPNPAILVLSFLAIFLLASPTLADFRVYSGRWNAWDEGGMDPTWGAIVTESEPDCTKR
jgi:hypothetical protein